MLCALCLSMFHNSHEGGFHHSCLENLQRAADGGCKICISLMARRTRFGPDLEREESANPFLTYTWSRQSRREWGILFNSHVYWLGCRPSPSNRVTVSLSEVQCTPDPWYTDLIERARYDLETSRPWTVRKETFDTIPIPPNTGHPEVLKLAKHWIQKCDQLHRYEDVGDRQSQAWYPKRLIDLSDPSQPSRLIVTDNEHPRGRYAALSHCWGPNPSFVVLNADNLHDFRRLLPPTLPRSFQDAIHICQALGIHYLWIDSICVLQAGPGSHEDWLLHTNVMSSIYRNSILTLAFDAASSPNHGAFVDRDATFLQPCCVFSDLADRLEKHHNRMIGARMAQNTKNETNNLYHEPEPNVVASAGDDHSSDEDQEGSDANSISSSTDSWFENDPSNILESTFHEDSPPELGIFLKATIFCDQDTCLALEDLPLSERGWAFQERTLSPRVLHFMSDRIAWECEHEPFLNEYLPERSGLFSWTFRIMNEPFCLPSQSDCDFSKALYRWTNCITHYSPRHLSYPAKDKLAAFAAVAQSYSAFLGEEYFAGHFLSEMPISLAWQCRWGEGREQKTKRIRRNPTWSWTSVDGPVIPLHLFHHPKCWKKVDMATVIDVQVKLINEHYKYGPIESGCVKIRGSLAQCVAIDVKNSHRSKFSILKWPGLEDTQWLNVDLFAMLDDLGQSPPHTFYCLLLVKLVPNKTEIFTNVAGGVFLDRDDTSLNTYRRIGAFSTGVNCVWGKSATAAIRSYETTMDVFQSLAGHERVIDIV